VLKNEWDYTSIPPYVFMVITGHLRLYIHNEAAGGGGGEKKPNFFWVFDFIIFFNLEKRIKRE